MNERIELNLHTKMGGGLIAPNEVVKEMRNRGYKVVALTDLNSVQAFPAVYKSVQEYNKTHEDKFKVLYGAELEVIDTHKSFYEKTASFVVLDIETTGIREDDEITMIIAQKWENGKAVEVFQKLVKPKKMLEKKVEEITHITNEMLETENTIDLVIGEFQNFIGSLPIVTSHASYMRHFLNIALKENGLETIKNPMYDLLKIAKNLYPDLKHYRLGDIAQYLNFPILNEGGLEYQVSIVGQIFLRLSLEAKSKKKEPFKITVLVRNQKGLKHLYELITLFHTQYKMGLPLEIIKEKSEGLLIGSKAETGEIERHLDDISEEELMESMLFYDYIEVTNTFHNRTFPFMNEKKRLKHLIDIALKFRKLVVATSNTHYLEKEEDLCFRVLTRKKSSDFRPCHLLTKQELLETFSFLGEKKAYEIVIENPNKINLLCEEIKITRESMCLPEIQNGEMELALTVYKKAHLLYGKKLPDEVEKRIAIELYGTPILKLKNPEFTIALGRQMVFKKVPECKGKGILGSFHEAMFLIPKMLIEKSHESTYFHESRGTVGSSVISYLLGISEVNPLPPHYRCPSCKHTIFPKGNALCGFDLEDKKCSNCGSVMKKDGHNIPYASFLGLEASLMPSMFLNLEESAIEAVHKKAFEIFGKDHVFYLGTVGAMSLKEAYSRVERFFNQTGENLSEAEKENIARTISYTKDRMGIYPSGILIIPKNHDIIEFTPVERIGNKYITHFDYHNLINILPKFDFLGHTDVTMFQKLVKSSSLDFMNISFDDKQVFDLFKTKKPLKLKKHIEIEIGTLGIPEFSMWEGISELRNLKIFPKNFSECVKLLGLSHGTGTFEDNALELLKKGISISEVIAHREDIMNKLLEHSLSYEEAFQIADFIGKGKHHIELEKWKTYKKRLQEVGLEDWYLSSCEKITYLFPKAHHTSYMLRLYRFLYAKIYDPKAFYKAYFECVSEWSKIEYQNQSYEEAKEKLLYLKEKKLYFKITDMEVLLEALAHGMKFD